MADKKISELDQALQINNDAVFPMSQDNSGTDTTYKASITQLSTEIGEGQTFSNLQTTSKKIVSAINELNSKGFVETATLANQSIATFTDGADNVPVKSLVSEIVAVQSGSGTPSPSNPRAISGFSQGVITVTDNDQITNTYTFNFGQTVYGGHFDNKGNLVVTHTSIELGNIFWDYDSTNARFYSTALQNLAKLPSSYSEKMDGVSDIFSVDSAENWNTNYTITMFPNGILTAKDTDYTNVTNFKNAMLNHYLVYELATPTTLAITSQDIPTLLGENNIFSNCGDVNKLVYFKTGCESIARLIEAYL